MAFNGPSESERKAAPPGPLPKSFSGFESIKKYWDPVQGIYAAKILPGEFYVTAHPQEMVVTVLGSCVSACIRDPKTGVGGMNHFMLPVDRSSGSTIEGNAERYGNYAMESLINAIASRGDGRRTGLEVKLTGGGRVLKMGTDIGGQNIAFVLEYVKAEHLNLLAEDLGDQYPRKVYYVPSTGRLRVKKLVEVRNDTLFARESRYAKSLEDKPVAGDVELF